MENYEKQFDKQKIPNEAESILESKQIETPGQNIVSDLEPLRREIEQSDQQKLQEVREKLGISEKQEDRVSAELTPEEQREKEAVYEEVKNGLAALYGSCLHDRKVEAQEARLSIDGTNLQKLSQPMKEVLADIIVRESLNQKPEDEFIGRGLEVLSIWIHTQALGRSATNKFQQLG
ncbi:MAG: hypothetical protein V1845_01990 [bacterium]